MDAFLYPSRQAEDAPRDPDTLEMFPQDTEALHGRLFRQEGAFLHQAELAAEALDRRVTKAHPSVKTFTLSRDELQHFAKQFGQVVSIAKGYHLDAADTAA